MMKISMTILTGIALASAWLAAPVANAQSAPPGDGWVSLFNGKDLTGWRTPDEPHDWSVVDGAIDFGGDGTTPGATYGPIGGHLYTEKSYTDYELSLEWRFKKGICHEPDSGIIFRGETPEVVHVMHVNLWCQPAGSGCLYAGDPKTCWATAKADKPLGEWNQMTFCNYSGRLT